MIYDGEILYANLTENGYDEEWIMTELKRRKLAVNDISYAVMGTKGNLYIELLRMQ
ncbi:YetF domain-containing protein [Neobacillus rhizophilus]|uniref:YetF domain-containing protein n=1 Tax=Neobacillus rhizophilus TaxID=2833579 RepID=UPI003556B6FF